MVDWRNTVHSILNHFLSPFESLNISVNRVSWLSLCVSIIASILLRIEHTILGIVSIFIVLFLDSLDGFLARKRGTASIDGFIVDVTCDRMSEFIIFHPNTFWTILAVVNTYVTILRIKYEKIPILPLRHVFMIITLIEIII